MKRSIAIEVDGRFVAPYFQPAHVALTPRFLAGRLMIPVRFFNVNMGVRAWWDRSWGTIAIGDGPVLLKDGVKEAHRPVPVIGGHVTEAVPLPVAPQFINGRLCAPLRATLELLGYHATWDAKNRAVRARLR